MDTLQITWRNRWQSKYLEGEVCEEIANRHSDNHDVNANISDLIKLGKLIFDEDAHTKSMNKNYNVIISNISNFLLFQYFLIFYRF